MAQQSDLCMSLFMISCLTILVRVPIKVLLLLLLLICHRLAVAHLDLNTLQVLYLLHDSPGPQYAAGSVSPPRPNWASVCCRFCVSSMTHLGLSMLQVLCLLHDSPGPHWASICCRFSISSMTQLGLYTLQVLHLLHDSLRPQYTAGSVSPT